MTYALVLLAASLTAQADVPAATGADLNSSPAAISAPAEVTPVPTPDPAAVPARAPEGEALSVVPATPVTPAPALDAPKAHAESFPLKKEPSFKRFGMMLDAGAPDGFGASAVFRPFQFLRLQLGAITTTSAFGIRGGVAYVPFNFWVTPSANFEVGRMFEGSTGFLNTFSGGNATQFTDTVVQRFSYTFVNGHLGLEIGSQQSFSFYIKGGLSYVDLELSDFQERFRASSGDNSFSVVTPHVHYSGPSAKLGFLFYFL
jgi:hypothetical protein